MRGYEEHLNWCRERREAAIEDLKDLNDGLFKHFDIKDGNQIDVTEDWKDHLKREIDMCDRLIKAYEANRA